MAGDWIKVETVTPDKPEVWLIAEKLDLSPDEVLGKLIRIWVWADQQTYNGDAGSVTRALLDRVTGCVGFADALLEAGWLRSESHGLVFPNFDRHNGKSAKRRSLTKKRTEAWRDAPSVTRASPEKRREEKSNTPPTPSKKRKKKAGVVDLPDIPAELDSPEFKVIWSEWQRHRTEKRQTLTPTAVRRQLKELAKMGADRAVAAIGHSITQGWTGIFEPGVQAAAQSGESAIDRHIRELESQTQEHQDE